MSLSAPSPSTPREQGTLPGQCLRSLVPSVPPKAQVCRVPGQTLTDASSESGRSPGFPQPHLTRRGWHAGHSGWTLPFLLLTHRYALRRYAETSPRATSRKRQAEHKNTKLFGSASRDPVGRRKDFPSRLSFSRRQCRRTSTVQGRGRSGAPRPARPGPGVRGAPAPALAQDKGHTARTVSHLPESPSGTRGGRNDPPRRDQITSARGGAGAGRPGPPLRARPVPPAPSASGGGASTAGRTLAPVQMPGPFYIHTSGQRQPFGALYVEDCFLLDYVSDFKI
ncbi:unnamed protein product [Rangifer tarandus platyrhynchus]|uniref:Uncharacterized protein n=2 Tax=Rangifer tarandus platyrhynchus TaxID=3082113 RepID=A0ABN8Z519_RANTA|nr:unnamed protein product [Rangifer tarandus platyrhynchus]CAI9703468.1 unnamed protein product [Rangifer tarandus platyrhynchus]